MVRWNAVARNSDVQGTGWSEGDEAAGYIAIRAQYSVEVYVWSGCVGLGAEQHGVFWFFIEVVMVVECSFKVGSIVSVS